MLRHFGAQLFVRRAPQQVFSSQRTATLPLQLHAAKAATNLAPSRASLTTAAGAKPIRQKIVLKDDELVETFVKGSGPGGQCINKRSSCVDLRHIPTGIRVQCQQTRSLQENRGIARKLLREKLDELVNGSLSKNAKKAAKIAKTKARRARRAKEKYAPSESAASPPSS